MQPAVKYLQLQFTNNCTQGSYGFIVNLRNLVCDLNMLTNLMSSKISGWSRSRCNILSFIACIIDIALSSAPCLELFSAAPIVYR